MIADKIGADPANMTAAPRSPRPTCLRHGRRVAPNRGRDGPLYYALPRADRRSPTPSPSTGAPGPMTAGAGPPGLGRRLRWPRRSTAGPVLRGGRRKIDRVQRMVRRCAARNGVIRLWWRTNCAAAGCSAAVSPHPATTGRRRPRPRRTSRGGRRGCWRSPTVQGGPEARRVRHDLIAAVFALGRGTTSSAAARPSTLGAPRRKRRRRQPADRLLLSRPRIVRSKRKKR